MSTFTVRIELYGSPTYETYKALHLSMESKNFQRVITQNNKKLYLPNAEYTGHGALSAQGVLETAKQATSSIWTNFGVMVTSTEVDRAYYNLQSV